MTNHRCWFLVLGLLATSAALCALTPQSYLDGNPQTKSDPNLYRVQILAVDGDQQFHQPVAITPGPHWLEIRALSDSRKIPKTQTVLLKIQPCTYYYLGAHRDSPVLDKWTLVVDEEDTIQACDPADELRKAKEVPPKDAPQTQRSP